MFLKYSTKNLLCLAYTPLTKTLNNSPSIFSLVSLGSKLSVSTVISFNKSVNSLIIYPVMICCDGSDNRYGINEQIIDFWISVEIFISGIRLYLINFLDNGINSKLSVIINGEDEPVKHHSTTRHVVDKSALNEEKNGILVCKIYNGLFITTMSIKRVITS